MGLNLGFATGVDDQRFVAGDLGVRLQPAVDERGAQAKCFRGGGDGVVRSGLGGSYCVCGLVLTGGLRLFGRSLGGLDGVSRLGSSGFRCVGGLLGCLACGGGRGANELVGALLERGGERAVGCSDAGSTGGYGSGGQDARGDFARGDDREQGH
ncbi:hypothetical protein KCX58_18990 [Paenarthrobacter ureafaciens]